MKIVLVEDETFAVEKLERYILKYDETISIVAKLSSINDAVAWFQTSQEYDVVFMDIQLTDGLSFEIFNRAEIIKPVIFTTAFDEYAIDAFKVNSIDYILKPITFTDVSKAMTKLKQLKTVYSDANQLQEAVNMIAEEKIKDRFLVRLGNHIHSIKAVDIDLFYAEGRIVYLVTNQPKKFVLDFKLEDLDLVLSSKEFFRVNRSFIININAIKDVVVYSNSRLKVTPKNKIEREIIVSREKVSNFKNWLEGS